MIVVRACVAAIALSLSAVACGAQDDGGGASASESSVTQGPASSSGGGEAPAAAPMSKEIHWLRNSAEYRAITRQTYALAARTLDAKVQAHKGGPWGVVLDCDETVLDNSEHQKESQGKPFSQEAWTAWVNRKEAKAIPGASAFTKHVRDLGGKVVIVTNRLEAGECPATEANLQAVKITYDAIHCKKDSSDKNPRFQAVAAEMEILEFIGDNIQDFPAQTQELASKDDAAFADFGSKFFTLPNPMYGSWEKNPQN